MIYMFLADGFEEVEALCPLDILRRAGLEVTTVGVGGKDVIRGAHGIIVHADIPDIMYRDSSPDMIILPGGMPGSSNLDESRIVDSALCAAHRHGKYLAAICAAPMVLGKLGILQGKKATCYPGFETYLEGAEYTAQLVEQDGNIVTGKGPGAAIPFAMTLVEMLVGKEMRQELEAGMMVS
jgi:4-methyl-5(b-hydroxyethyl)-thiazole monophosphate biosynthesis